MPLRGCKYEGTIMRSRNLKVVFARCPWLLLGAFAGFVFANMTGLLSRGGAEASCGAVPVAAPPLIRRQLDGKVRNVLVTGGAGFIGSHFVLALIDRTGFNITIVDNLSRGSIETVLRLQAIASRRGQTLAFEAVDVNEQFTLEDVMRRNNIDLVVHFSGNAYVGESVARPNDYFQNITVRLPSHASLLTGFGRMQISPFVSRHSARPVATAPTALPRRHPGIYHSSPTCDAPRGARSLHILFLLRHLRRAKCIPDHGIHTATPIQSIWTS